MNVVYSCYYCCYYFQTIPYLRVILVLNCGALLFAFVRIYLVQSATLYQAQSHIASLPSCPTHQHLSDTNSDAQHSPENHTHFQVPNIIHYIWYNTQTSPLKFHHLLSILSAHKILKPDIIYFHTDRDPDGPYWERVKKIPNFRVMHRKPPLELYGEAIKEPMFYTSHSNVDRVKILMEYGGIYMDLDTFVIQPLDELRKYECTIGMEQDTKACGSIIICSKHAMFLKMWITSYLDDYRMDEWAYNTGKVPANIARRFPELVHVEETRLNRPNFNELDKIWGPNWFNWHHNYALHIWYRIWKDMSPYYNGIEPDPNTIKTMNNTFGEMARSIYYGSSAIIPKDNLE